MIKLKITTLFIFIFLLAFPLVSDKIVYAQGCGRLCGLNEQCDSSLTCGAMNLCWGDDCTCTPVIEPNAPGICTYPMLCTGLMSYEGECGDSGDIGCCYEPVDEDDGGRCGDTCNNSGDCAEDFNCDNNYCVSQLSCPACIGETTNEPGFCELPGVCLSRGWHPEPSTCSGNFGSTCCTDTPTGQTCSFADLPPEITLGNVYTINFTSNTPNTNYVAWVDPADCTIIPSNFTTDSNGNREITLQCLDIGDMQIKASLLLAPTVPVCSQDFIVEERCPAWGCPTDHGSVLCSDGESINTAIGCIPISGGDEFMGFILGWAIGIAGGTALLLIAFAGIQIMTAAGNPQKIQAGKELLTAAITGFLFVLFSVYLLEFIGVRILNIPGL